MNCIAGCLCYLCLIGTISSLMKWMTEIDSLTEMPWAMEGRNRDIWNSTRKNSCLPPNRTEPRSFSKFSLSFFPVLSNGLRNFTFCSLGTRARRNDFFNSKCKAKAIVLSIFDKDWNKEIGLHVPMNSVSIYLYL